MNKRIKITLFIIISLLVVCTLLSLSYAYYVLGSNNANNPVSINVPSCVKLALTNSVNISQTGNNAVPISDAKALSSTNYRYSFSIQNACSSETTLKLALLENANNTMPIRAVKYALIEQGDTVPSTGSYLINTPINFDADALKELGFNSISNTQGYLLSSNTSIPANTTKNYYLYIWIDYYEGDQEQNGLYNNTTMNKALNLNLFISSGTMGTIQ